MTYIREFKRDYKPGHGRMVDIPRDIRYRRHSLRHANEVDLVHAKCGDCGMPTDLNHAQGCMTQQSR